MDVPSNHILVLNLHLEMIDIANSMYPFASGDQPGPEAGCTNIAVEREGGDGCLIGQTYDLRSFYENAAFAFRTISNGLKISGLSFAGVLGATA